MEISMNQEDELICSQCNKRFKIKIWLIVDTIKRSDLVKQIRAGTLHDFPCPKCRLVASIDAPLLLYQPGKTPTLIFSPAENTAEEEDRMLALGLMGTLRKRLGREWQDGFLEKAYVVPRESLPAHLDGDAEEGADARRRANRDVQVDLPPGVPSALQADAEEAALAMHAYKTNSEEYALDLAIAAWLRVLRHPAFAQAPSSFQWRVYNDAGNAYIFRCQIRKELADLDIGISLWSEAVKHASGPEIRCVIYHNLAGVYDTRYRLTGNKQDLEQAIEHHRRAVEHAPANSPLLPGYLTFQGNDLLDQYKQDGHHTDLEEAVDCFRQAVQRTPRGSPDLPDYLKNLANGLSSLFDLTENLQDLGQAIQYHRQARSLLSPASPDVHLYLSNLGASLGKRYNISGNVQDLDEAVELFQEAVDRAPLDSPDLPDYLVNLGMALTKRYGRLGHLRDLERAIECLREAVAHSDLDSPEYPDCLSQLGISLYELFAYTREEKHLEEAISTLRRAVDRTSNDLHLPSRLNALSGVILERYRSKGQVVYLEEAIAMQREALERASSGIPALWRLLRYNLGMMLAIRYERLKESSDIKEAISLFLEAVQNFPPDSLDRPMAYVSLGDALRSRYNNTKESEDLDRAIQALRRAIQLLPPDSVELRRAYHDLANALGDQYDLTKRLEVLDEAITLYEKSSDGTEGISTRCIRLCNLGKWLHERYLRLGQSQDLLRSKACYEQACGEGLQVVPEVILRQSRLWGHTTADRGEWKEAAQAYSYALRAFEMLYKSQILQGDRETWAGDAGGLYDRAAYVMARAGQLRAAVVTLEKGRAKTLSETLAQDHADLERIKQDYPEAYQRYRTAVENARSLERNERAGGFASPERRPWSAAETLTVEQANKARAELEEAIIQIRRIPGYQTFLSEPTFEDISKAALPNSPLVYIAVTPRGSLTLLMYSGGTAPEMLLEQNFDQDRLHNMLAEQGWGQRWSKDEGQFALPRGLLPAQALPGDLMRSALVRELRETLPILGAHLTAPIAQRLLASGVTQVVLIPTGVLGLLPLHAASYQSQGKQECLLDSFDVAYAPSARALTIARQEAEERRSFPLYLVGVGNPLPSDPQMAEREDKSSFSLPYARSEVETIMGLLPAQAGLALYEDEATSEAVWKRLPEATIAHFSCHGIFDPAMPLDSALSLAQETQLTLRDLLNADQRALDRLHLVVLSACQTALIDFRRLPDEVIGLLSGFLQAGIPSVVGTLWPVVEFSTALLMVRFYELFLRGDPEAGVPPQTAVHALRLAQCWLRDLTYSDLGAYAPHLSGWKLDFLPGILKREEKRNELPYADPFYWAAFAYYGAV